jgi:beta-barrel assembly-enhancing protease
MRQRPCCFLLFVLFVSGQAAHAQIGSIFKGGLDKADKVSAKMKDIEVTEAEEIKIGEDVSLRLRTKYGVIQDADVHRYVSLVGNVVKEKSSRSSLPFQFIVLDTDGVNAFAAPGGFIHITRGALSLMKNEAELAGVLAHEIAHVTEKHTIHAIQKGKLVQMGSDQTSVSSNPAVFQRLKDEAFKAVFAGFSREDELDADEHGITVAAGAGYAPNGLPVFLDALKQRNSGSDRPQGLFSSHPQMDERLQKLAAIIASHNWTSTIAVQDRFANNIKYTAVDIAKIVQAEEGSSGLAGETKDDSKKDDAKKDDGTDGSKKKSRFGLSSIKNPLSSQGSTTQSAEVTGSGGSRGLDRERGARGGANPSPVPVILTAADLEQFKREGGLIRS